MWLNVDMTPLIVGKCSDHASVYTVRYLCITLKIRHKSYYSFVTFHFRNPNKT